MGGMTKKEAVGGLGEVPITVIYNFSHLTLKLSFYSIKQNSSCTSPHPPQAHRHFVLLTQNFENELDSFD